MPPSKSSPSKFGTALAGTRRRGWCTGSITAYSPAAQTYQVTTSFGVQEDVPRLVRDPGEITILAPDTVVVLHDELGYYVIDSVMKLAPANVAELNPTRVSEVRGIGGENPTYALPPNSTTFRSANDPLDVLAGDWVEKSIDGNLMAVLTGGVNVMKSSPFAQVRTHGLNDMVEIISNTYQHLTSMGDLQIVNDGGKTSLIWRAGCDQQTENGAQTENWTIRLDVGATGGIFNFEITQPEGQTLARIHMSADGRIELLGTAGVDITSGGNGTHREDISADKELDVGGAYGVSVQDDVTETLNAGRSTTVSKNSTLVVGNDLGENVNHDRNAYVGRKMVTTVQGGLPVPPPAAGTPALHWEVINGGVETVVGNIASGALPTLAQSQNWVNYAPNGCFNFALQPTAIGGKFNVISNLPGSVNLGANGSAIPNPLTGGHDIIAVAPFGVMKFEPWQSLMQQMLTWMDNHVHLSAVGPTSPAQAGPLGPITPQISPAIPLVKSQRVSVGL